MSDFELEKKEEAAEASEEIVEAVENAPEAPATEVIEEAPKKKAAVHMTASAAALNAEGEVDIRRRKPREVKEIKTSRISYEKKKGLYGYGFVALWVVGVIYMFLIPLCQSLWYSFSKTEMVSASDVAKMEAYGMTGPGIYTEWNDFGNYKWAFTVNSDYPKNLVDSLVETAYTVPLVLVFSLFVALLLNGKFKGRTLARAVFFLPVLIATGPVLSVINGDMLSKGISDASQFSALFKTDFVQEFLQFMGLNNISQSLADTFQEVTGTILNLIWDSGIQILIFISALQQIPTSAKEAASMEGATGWEFFWKITFPTISPMIFVNLIYTVIDAFIKSDNPVMKQVMDYVKTWDYGYSAAMAWAYFAIVAVVLGIISAIVSRFIFYQVD